LRFTEINNTDSTLIPGRPKSASASRRIWRDKMNSKFERSVMSALCVGVIFCLAAVATLAQDLPNVPAQVSQDPPQDPQAVPAPPCVIPCPSAPCNGKGSDHLKHAQHGSSDASEVFKEFAVVRDKIPQDVLCKAVAIGVFKGVFNAAFTFGYRQGNGSIIVHTPCGWSAPVYYKMKGGSFGWQIGATSTDYVLVFMSKESVRDLADGEFDLALDANAVAGPVFGARASAGHPDFPKSKTVFVYARSKGLFAGAVIDGAKLYARNHVNRDLYGMNALDLLSDPQRIPTMCAACLPQGVSDFPLTVAAAIPSQTPSAQPVAVAAPQPQPEPPAPQRPMPTPKPVVDIKEEEIIVVVEQPQKQTPRASKRRAHKMKH